MRCVVPFVLVISVFTATARAAPTDRPTISGSPTYTAIAQEVVAACGEASSASYSGHHTFGGTSTGLSATSSGFSIVGGVEPTTFVPAPSPPLVLGTIPNTGSPTGGAAVTVVGFNFNASSSASFQVFIDGVPTSSGGPMGNTTIMATAPPCADSQGNPCGPVEVGLLASQGQDSAPDAYRYLPAVTQLGPAKAGECVTFSIQDAAPQYFLALFVGLPPGAFGPTLPGAGGSLLIPAPFVLIPPFFSPADEVRIPVSIPGGLSGASAGIQALVLSAVSPNVVGQFTNALTVTVE